MGDVWVMTTSNGYFEGVFATRMDAEDALAQMPDERTASNMRIHKEPVEGGRTR